MDAEIVKIDPRFKELSGNVISYLDKNSTLLKDQFKKNPKNGSWRTILFFPQTILISFKKMSNVNSVYFEDFEYGCEMSISISEYETGPYTTLVKNKFFPRSELRKIKLGTLPCRYLKIVIHKGALVNPASVHVYGFLSEDAPDLFGEEQFQLLVSNPQRLMYF